MPNFCPLNPISRTGHPFPSLDIQFWNWDICFCLPWNPSVVLGDCSIGALVPIWEWLTVPILSLIYCTIPIFIPLLNWSCLHWDTPRYFSYGSSTGKNSSSSSTGCKKKSIARTGTATMSSNIYKWAVDLIKLLLWCLFASYLHKRLFEIYSWGCNNCVGVAFSWRELYVFRTMFYVSWEFWSFGSWDLAAL